jgi:alpha-beta hydrolase superfamily lysophospholipase
MEKISFTNHLGMEIQAYKWFPESTQPKAIIQIAHGMSEHALRFAHVAEALTKNGFAVYANDHQGHGQTGKNNLGLLGSEGWAGCVKDLKQLNDIIKKNYPALPVFYLGHSWGSLMGQDYIQQWGNDFKGVIFTGTYGRKAKLKLLLSVGKAIMKIQGLKSTATIIYKIAVGPFSKPFQPVKTPYDWRSSDEAVIQEFISDPLAGFKVTNGWFLEFGLAIKRIWQPENEAKIPKTLGVMLLNGEFDSTCAMPVDFLLLKDRYQALGITNIQTKIYADCRHSVFDDVKRNEVIQDVITWLDTQL